MVFELFGIKPFFSRNRARISLTALSVSVSMLLVLICSSCATGPAFEGATIRHGMRAAEGAIESLHIDPATFEVDFDIIGEKGMKAKGICGSGIINGVAEMLTAGILKNNGQFNKNLTSRRLRFDSEGPVLSLPGPMKRLPGRKSSYVSMMCERFRWPRGLSIPQQNL